MFTNSKLTKSIRLAMAFGAASSLMAASGSALAQEEGAQESVEKISVTGSRIRKANMVSSSPVLEISAEDIAVRGITRVEDLLNDLPSIFAAQTSGIANGSTGTATVDLRNLGSERTLVLFNGRRLPSGSPLAGGIGADVNQIPANLVERVEILTGGASATYGSDAVAGVVNFIMKDDFEGFNFDFNYNFYQHDNDNTGLQSVNSDANYTAPNGNVTDGHTRDFAISFGANTADDRGNVTMYATYRKVAPVLQGDRDYSNCALRANDDDSLFCAGSTTLPEGRITDFGLADTSFDYIVSGNEFVNRDGLTYNYAPGNYYQRPDERMTLGAFAHYEINEHLDIYAETNFMDDRSVAQIAPSGAFFVTSSLNCNNPLLSEQQFEAICGINGLTEDDNVTAFLGRRNVEGANRQDDLRHTSWRGVVGARGLINDSWSYDVFANYATVSLSQVYRNDLSTTRITRALNVVPDENGNAVCQSVVDGSDPNCVPYNIFTEGGITDAVLNYLTLPLFARGETVTTQVSGFVAGDLTDMGIAVPGTSVGMNVVFGLERRTEELVFEPDNGFASGDGAGQGGPTTGVRGDFSVEEIFTEFNLPLLEGVTGAEELNFEFAYRYSDYSTDQSTNTFKYGLDWMINEDVRVRANFQRAVRAGNVRELFRPQSLGLFNMNEDPCAGSTPDYTLEQCQRTGVTAAQYGSVADNPAGQYNSITGGNPDLEPEESDTISFGVVLSPSALPQFSLALDYFDITVDKAIDQVPERFILDQCALNNDPEFCALVNRGAAGTLWLGNDNIVSTDINIGSFETAGIDFDAAYDIELADSTLKLNLIGTYLTKWDQQSTPAARVEECLGYWDRTSCGAPTPDLRFNLTATWVTAWDANITMTWRHFGEADELDLDEDGVTQIAGQTTLEDQNYLDVSASWNAMENVTLRLGVNNLLDREPPIVPNAPSGSGNGNTFPGPYDALGRNVFMGVNVSF